jgi:molecular chaperone DnaJ
MDGRTYYMILGVSPTESPSGIRSAYRDLAKRLHPDVAGEQTTQAFQELREAYHVLSDPHRRRAYNDELRRAGGGDITPIRSGPLAPPRKSEPAQGLNVEVVLTPEEGRRGCMLPIGVPVFRRCPRCGGFGRHWLFACDVCGQRGIIENEQIVRVDIPPTARSGSIYEVRLQGFGIHNLYLRLLVFVESEVAKSKEVDHVVRMQ